MALKTYKATTHSLRHTIRVDRSELSDVLPEKTLLMKLVDNASRNAHGRITMRGRQGHEKRNYRIIDFAREKRDIEGTVKTIEYDPYRTAFIALIQYKDGDKRYIIAPKDLKIGDNIMSGENAEPKLGNAMPLNKIPLGIAVHNIQLDPNKGSTFVRSAGSSAQVMGLHGEYVQVKLPSTEIRLVLGVNYATIGEISNGDNINQQIGKAGRMRHMGRRPIVRGVAQDPAGHPHGGGQGKAGRHGTGGPPVDKWGNKVGKKTRNNKVTQRFIIQKRNK
ncbi:MAG: 50S ribosomal protein L2 [bacterium]